MPTRRVNGPSVKFKATSSWLWTSLARAGLRQDRDAEAGFDRALDRLDVVELHRVAHRRAVRRSSWSISLRVGMSRSKAMKPRRRAAAS